MGENAEAGTGLNGMRHTVCGVHYALYGVQCLLKYLPRYVCSIWYLGIWSMRYLAPTVGDLGKGARIICVYLGCWADNVMHVSST